MSRGSSATIERDRLLAIGRKVCKICGVEKDLDQYRKAKSKSGVHSYCKPCDDMYKVTWHLKRRLEIKEWIYDYLTSHSCVDCGQSDVLQLDFDHVKGGRKRFNIAHAFMLKGMTIKKLETEIAKCDVRCRGCHAIRTHMISNSWKYRMYLERNKDVSKAS